MSYVIDVNGTPVTVYVYTLPTSGTILADGGYPVPDGCRGHEWLKHESVMGYTAHCRACHPATKCRHCTPLVAAGQRRVVA